MTKILFTYLGYLVSVIVSGMLLAPLVAPEGGPLHWQVLVALVCMLSLLAAHCYLSGRSAGITAVRCGLSLMIADGGAQRSLLETRDHLREKGLI